MAMAAAAGSGAIGLRDFRARRRNVRINLECDSHGARAKMTPWFSWSDCRPRIEAQIGQTFRQKRKLADGTPGCETRRTPGFIYLPRCAHGHVHPRPAPRSLHRESSPKNNHSPGSTPKSISQIPEGPISRRDRKLAKLQSRNIEYTMKRLRER